MTNPIIQLTDISASYDEKTVLSHVNLTVYERDFLGVIGPMVAENHTDQDHTRVTEARFGQCPFL